MRTFLLLLILIAPPLCVAQQGASAPDAPAPMRSEFHVRYISGSNVYVDGGRNAGLAEGTELVLKQQAGSPSKEGDGAAVEPGVVARLKVVSVASSSAVCEVVSTTRELTTEDVVSMPDAEIEKIVEEHTLGNTRLYPMVISFSTGDPLDEEQREAVPHPPLPEINQARGRIGFDMSMIRGMGSSPSTSSSYGMVFRADISRILGTHWNLNGYWRGSLQSGSTQSQPTIQDLINRTYQISLTYLNPESQWTAGIGRLYLPWAPSLEVIDGGYVGRSVSANSIVGLFGGSTPDPTAWNYNPHRQIAGAFFNAHGGDFEHFRYSTTTGFGVNLLSWNMDRPFVFTENDFSFKRQFSVYHSMQIDRPTANPSSPPVAAGIGQSLLSLRIQAHPRLALDLTHTYFRDVPTYDASLVGTGLLDQYLFQGVNGGARVQLPEHIAGYFTLGRSSTSADSGSSLNMLFGATMANIWKTGLQVDAHYSKFDSVFASGNYRSITVSRDLGERFRMDLQGGRELYNSPLSTNRGSYFMNLLFDANIGSRYFIQNAFTTQMGGAQDYNQWTSTFGYRFDNRRPNRRSANAIHP